MAKRKVKLDADGKKERVRKLYALIEDTGKRMATEKALGEVAMCQSKIKKWRGELKILQRR